MFKEIASIYPIHQHAERSLYGGVFDLPAGDKDKPPVIIKIQDHVQIEPLPYFYAAPGSGRAPKARILVSCVEIANDLIRDWTTTVVGMSGDRHPGIWVVRDTLPVYDDDGKPVMSALGPQELRPATPEEKKAMFQEDWDNAKIVQANWAERSIEIGDVMAQEPKAYPFIPTYAKILCKHYGRDRKWLNALRDNDIKKCGFCMTAIDRDATVCPQCGRDQVVKKEHKQAVA